MTFDTRQLPPQKVLKLKLISSPSMKYGPGYKGLFFFHIDIVTYCKTNIYFDTSIE